MRKTAIFVLVLGFAACGGTTNPGDDDGTPDAPGQPDAPPIPDGFTRLIGRTWSLPAGATDTYRCVRVTIPTDTYITNIIAQAPAGTHHTVLSIAGGNGTAGPDGEQDCTVNTIGQEMMYASGVGTSPLDFPVGVGVKVGAGEQIHLNLHLFNATDQPINGDSAILVKQQPTPPPMIAEMVFGGTFQIVLPSSPNPRTLNGVCTANAPYTLFAVWPHQHQLGTHHKVELNRGGVRTLLHDAPYQFSEQEYYLKTPEVAIQQGDRIETACTWINNTGSTVTFGESSTQEMCFTGLYRYPAQNNGLFCSN